MVFVKNLLRELSVSTVIFLWVYETPDYERIEKQVCSFPLVVKDIPTSEHQKLISNTRTVSGSLCHGI